VAVALITVVASGSHLTYLSIVTIYLSGGGICKKCFLKLKKLI
jgi:hypothetical protein